MNIQTQDAQVWWVAIADELRPVRGIDARVLTEGLRSALNFSAPPNVLKDGGIEFLDGRIGGGDGLILISKLTVFNDGVNVQVPGDTANAETVLQRVLEFVFSIGVRKPVSPPVHFYQSVVVADFEHSLENLFPASLLAGISAALPMPTVSSVFNLSFNSDQSTVRDARWRGINPSLFKIERRGSAAYDLNRYFCLANMRTADHLPLLHEFERLASKAGS